jgi:hypothetical protein
MALIGAIPWYNLHNQQVVYFMPSLAFTKAPASTALEE